jgi:hypothetical protein
MNSDIWTVLVQTAPVIPFRCFAADLLAPWDQIPLCAVEGTPERLAEPDLSVKAKPPLLGAGTNFRIQHYFTFV